MEKGKGSEKLLKRLYASRAYHRSGEPLAKIARDLTDQQPFNGVEKTTYQSLYKHCKYHQALTTEDLVESRIMRSAKKKDNAFIRELVKHQDVRQKIMQKGVEQIESGEVKLTAAAVVTAANKEADIELKEKDQKIKVMEMIAAYQSGELQRSGQDFIDGNND